MVRACPSRSGGTKNRVICQEISKPQIPKLFFNLISTMPEANEEAADALVHSSDPEHPANHICTLCAKFYTLGWVQLTICPPAMLIRPNIYVVIEKANPSN